MGDVSTQRMNVARGRVEEQASAVEKQKEESRARAEATQAGAEKAMAAMDTRLPRAAEGRGQARRQRYRLSALSPAQHEMRAQKVVVEESGLPGEAVVHNDPTGPSRSRRRLVDPVLPRQDPGLQWGEDLPDQRPAPGGDPGGDLARNYDWFQQREGGDAQAYKPEKRRYRLVGATTGQGKPNDGDPYTPGEVKV